MSDKVQRGLTLKFEIFCWFLSWASWMRRAVFSGLLCCLVNCKEVEWELEQEVCLYQFYAVRNFTTQMLPFRWTNTKLKVAGQVCSFGLQTVNWSVIFERVAQWCTILMSSWLNLPASVSGIHKPKMFVANSMDLTEFLQKLWYRKKTK